MKMEEDMYMDSSMYKAAREGNFTGLENSIRQKHGANREEEALLLETRKRNNLVHLAAESGHKDFILQVLQKCPQLAAKPNSCGDTPLHVAARTGLSHIVTAVLSKAKLQGKTPTTDTPSTRQMKEMENGGTAGINNSLLRLENMGKNTALHEALRNGNEEVGMYLFDQDKEMAGSVNKSDESALYLAAELGIEKVVKAMVEFLDRQRGGDVWHGALSGPDGRNPLHAAVLAGNIGCVDALIKLQGSNMINKPDNNGRTALHFAAKAKQKEITARLLRTDPSSAYAKDLIHGRTPLLEAASSGDLCLLREILEHCPDTVEISDNEGRNAVHLALKCEPSYSKEVLKVPELVKLVNKADCRRDTPLHMAAKDHNYKIVKKLLMNPEVDLRAKNADGLTFLDICESRWQYTMKKKYLYQHLKDLPADRRLPPTLNPSAKHLTPLDKPEADLRGHANALTVVATLLATITFAAAFTLPGGLTPDDGGAHPPLPSPSSNFHDSPDYPPPKKLSSPSYLEPGHAILIGQSAFKVFILADILAVSTSLMVLFVLISAMLADQTVLRKAIAYSKKLLYLSLGGTMVAFMTGLYSVISTDVGWLAVAVCVIGSSVPFLTKYFQVKSFTSSPVLLHRFLSRKSSKWIAPEPPSSSRIERVRDESESFDEAAKREARPVQLRQLSRRTRSGSSKLYTYT
ncbi:ankyrin repeat-containing protein At5g02620-like isoform X2 [Syzygium oleosum]|nr:ankyrin repeat-containing protein At5g02620-like isoform X2 [Syzygium oleosum]XP_056172973.1 ankyrin repeat-containing protein At5g02620-like isoform X2 [Syzygium oleosum]